MTFREDGADALDWAARYLDRVGELPVLAQVEPGWVRSQLPPRAPDTGEPFPAVLRDLEEILLPAMTHWQSPRYFGYFAISSSEPAILAELLAATINQNAILWRTSPASTELEGVVLDWVADLLGLPVGWHGHIEDTASTSTLVGLAAARELAPDRRFVVASEQAHSSVEKAAKILGLEMRTAPVDDAFRLRADALDLDGACAVVATVGTTSTASVDPVAGDCRRVRGGRRLAPRRRRVRGVGDGLPGAALGLRGCRSRRLARRQRAQVDACAGRLLARLEPAAGGAS